jgi:hypothetical protein
LFAPPALGGPDAHRKKVIIKNGGRADAEWPIRFALHDKKHIDPPLRGAPQVAYEAPAGKKTGIHNHDALLRVAYADAIHGFNVRGMLRFP